jgi:hypothetical protein
LALGQLHGSDSRDALRSDRAGLDVLRVESTQHKLLDLAADLDIEGEPAASGTSTLPDVHCPVGARQKCEQGRGHGEEVSRTDSACRVFTGYHVKDTKPCYLI